MAELDADQQRQFARHVVDKLRAAGFEALWAGGCVRDRLLDRRPQDYDVATNATPAQVRDLFGRRRTLLIGAAFGVAAVVGPKEAGTVEVTTFRRDSEYLDGRHPESVTFSNAEDDALRRDFTINGLFFDPVEQRVIDYVGGVEDIERGVVRAIGDARARFSEDKLRMVRAVRIAAAFDFALDAATSAAIREMAATIRVVAVERVAVEMRKMLTGAKRRRALELLRETELLDALWPDLACRTEADSVVWTRTLARLDAIGAASFPLALAALLYDLDGADAARRAGDQWRLSNQEQDRAAWLLEHARDVLIAHSSPWSSLQPLLVHAGSRELLALAEAECAAQGADIQGVEHCRQRLALDRAILDPPVLLTGKDLIAHGVERGPVFSRLLAAVRDAQLDGLIGSRDEAIALVDRLLREPSD